MIFDEWKKFRGWVVLEYFLRHEREIHVKELARKLKISPQTASYYLKFYRDEKILQEKRTANLSLYSLADNPLVRQLKIFYMISTIYPLAREMCEKINATTVAIYGSCASGTYDSKSDVDILIISQKRQIPSSYVKRLESILEREVNITVLSMGEWRKMKREKDEFAMAVLSNHIVVCGASL